MDNELLTDIYATLIGVIDEKHRVPGIENAFAPGSYCDRRYEDMMDHRQRIWERLGAEDDEDLEGAHHGPGIHPGGAVHEHVPLRRPIRRTVPRPFPGANVMHPPLRNRRRIV